MKISLAQMAISEDLRENERKTLTCCDEAAESDLLFFPEVQYAPFFPQYEHYDVEPCATVSAVMVPLSSQGSL